MPKKDNSKSPYSRSEKKYVKWEKEGRGTGSGLDYIPGLFITEVPSVEGNRKHSVPGIKASGRLTQLMSDLEFWIWLFFDLAKNVIDIREQVPLKRSVTLSIAEKLKIRHPSVKDANTGEMIAHWMTTDLLIDYFDLQGTVQQLAVYIKPAEKLVGANLKKLVIEYAYWSLKGVRFCIITDECIPKEIWKNFDYVSTFYESESSIKELYPNLNTIEPLILNAIKNSNNQINNLCSEIDRSNNLNPGCSLSIFYYMIASRKIDVNLKQTSIGPKTHSSFLRKHLE